MAERMYSIPHTLDGFLLQWRAPKMSSGEASDPGELIDAFIAIPELRLLDIRLKPRGWYAFELESPRSLQPNVDQSDQSIYRYFLMVRIQAKTGSVVVATASRGLTRAIIDQFLNRDIRPNLQPIQLLTGELATQLVEHEDS